MGVVVQRLVAADAAGVAMTLDPANGDRTTVAIESSFGLGEMVVGGEVTPDSFRVDKVLLEITSSAIADKHVELRPGSKGPTDVEPERRGAPSLSPQQVRAVAALAKQAERHYGCPQDIEWAVVGVDVVLLKSRPETVWSRKRAEQSVYKTGLAGIVDTLVNPLAARKEHG
jgi:pyruvate,water dikinase